MPKTEQLNPVKEIEILWEYTVKSEYIDEFINIYAPGGAWSELFKKYPGYIETKLIQDTSNKTRFITRDRWASFTDYDEMKNRSRKEYRALDERCEKFTVDENYLGVFQTIK